MSAAAPYFDLGSYSRPTGTPSGRACQHPNNVWSLHGLHECLVRRGEFAEAALIKQQLDLAAGRADVPIVASCACRLHTA